ncbi:MAG: AAA family ATPase [Acidobacteria bacterium]|nr:AAA family ATPase [Acidobacteriota bacterium]
MKVKAIRLQNFMGFVDTGWIELRPITLLFGRNSSGKSAIIRAILLLRQSLRTNNGQPLEFDSHNGANLGSFERMIHGRKIIEEDGRLRKMTFGFRCDIGEDLLKDLRSPDLTEPFSTCADLFLSFQWNTDKVELAEVLLQTPFTVRADHPEKRTILAADYLGNVSGQPDWFLSSNFYDLHFPYQEFPWPEEPTWVPSLKIIRLADFAASSSRHELLKKVDRLFVSKNEDSFLPVLAPENRDELRVSQSGKDHFWITEDRASHDVTKVLNVYIACSESIREWLGEGVIRHLGPIRFAPRRSYLFRDLSRHEWDDTGQAAIHDFARMKLAQSDQGSADRDRVNDWFEHLELGKELHVEPIRPFSAPDEPAEGFRIEIHEGGPHPDFNLRDVGYGASQVLPVVLQALFAPPSAFVIVEQPELHLHPEAQAKLADLFIESVNDTRNDDGRASRFYLLETHSETLFLRLRVELARTTACTVVKRFALIPEDIICHFIERPDRAKVISKLEPMLFNKKGEYENEPDGFVEFFGQDFKEILDLENARSGGIGGL